MSQSEHKELARRFVREVWNGKNLDVVDELYHPDYTGHWFLPGGGEATREDVKTFIGGVHQGFPDYEMTIEFVHAEDDLVTFGFTSTGTHDGDWMGIPPQSTPAELDGSVPGHVTLRIEDGQAIEGWATWDALGLLQKLGIVPEDFGEMPAAAD